MLSPQKETATPTAGNNPETFSEGALSRLEERVGWSVFRWERVRAGACAGSGACMTACV